MFEIIGIVGLIATLIGLESTTVILYRKMLIDEMKKIEKEKEKNK